MKLKDYIVTYEEWNNAVFNRTWGYNTLTGIDGKLAYQKSRNSHGKYVIAGGEQLIQGVNYIFRYSKDRTKLIPARVSMHPKTYSNISKGSERYGSASILRECF